MQESRTFEPEQSENKELRNDELISENTSRRK